MLEELNQIHASEELIQETLQYCKDNKSSGRTINNTETNSARVKGITRKINRWAVAAAYAERGYQAFGSEYLLVIITFALSFCIIKYFFER